jgi:hypothetical protein
VVYLATLLVGQTITVLNHRVISEKCISRMWKKDCRLISGNILAVAWKDGRSPGPDLNYRTPEYEAALDRDFEYFESINDH